MDSAADPQAFDDKTGESTGQGGADEAPKAAGEVTGASSHALTPISANALASTPDEAEKAEPRHTEIPSSALLVLPPEKDTFREGFAAGERPAGAGHEKRASWAAFCLRAAAVLAIAAGGYAAAAHYLSIPGVSASGAAKPSVAASATPALPKMPETASAAPNPVLHTGVAQKAEVSRLQNDTEVLRDEVHKLQTRLAEWQTQTPQEIRSLKRTIGTLKAGLEAERAASKAQIAQLSAKLDHLHQVELRAETAAKARAPERNAKAIQATLNKVARNETDHDATGMITAEASPSALHPARLQDSQPERAPRHGPQLLSDWTVRDVYRGIALVEGPRGAVEVMPGDVLPGAGTVRAIQRRGGGWIVVTSRGYVDYDHE